jgi:hypothetical protein
MNVVGVWFCRSSAAIANPGNAVLENNTTEPREPRTAAATIKVFFYCCEVLKSFCVVVKTVNRKEGRKEELQTHHESSGLGNELPDLLSEKVSASAIQLQQNILNVMSNTV